MDKYRINVDVLTKFMPDQSSIEDCKFTFCYTITIVNDGHLPAKLLRRRWLITNANGKIKHIEGDGVIGEQPHIQPGESFCYTSAAILDTPVGCMQGSYEMLCDDGTAFDATISPFGLAVPDLVH